MKRKNKDYQKKSFHNPFFSKKNSGKHSWFKVIILLIIIAGSLIFLSQRKFFAITDINITGSQTVLAKEISSIINDQLAQKRFWFFSQNSILFFDSNKLAKQLNQNYIFTDLKVKKQLFNRLNIEIKEDIAPFFWFTENKKYYLNSSGLIFKEVSDQDLSIYDGGEGTATIRFSPMATNYPVVFDQSNTSAAVGQLIIDSNKVDFITKLTETITKSADFEIARYLIDSPSSLDLNLVTAEGWQTYFRMTESLSQQFNKLLMILQQRLDDRNNLEYIDLRFAEKVFYK